MSFLKSQAASLGLHNDSLLSKQSADEPARQTSNPPKELEDTKERLKELPVIKEQEKPSIKKGK